TQWLANHRNVDPTQRQSLFLPPGPTPNRQTRCASQMGRKVATIREGNTRGSNRRVERAGPGGPSRRGELLATDAPQKCGLAGLDGDPRRATDSESNKT